MKSFISLSPEERAVYFIESEAKDGRFSSTIYEKDFWVCWTLRKLFELPTLGKHLTFKGGTSLSKIYNVISRFSEDIDVSIHRSFFGFDGENDPENAKSSNERNKKLLDLSIASSKLIQTEILPTLEKTFQSEIEGKWQLSIDSKDPQTILFYYPTTTQFNSEHYIKAAVKIEFGARSDNWPQESGKILPYISEVYPSEVNDIATCNVRVLTKARTFWEKATILHAEHHRPASSESPTRHSRHFYDLYCISKQRDASDILSDLGLLERVVQHKKIFFRSAWANYASAIVGTLRLYPKESQIKHLMEDYRSMQPMFFNNPPEFEDILKAIKQIETEINS
jgi:hypothetical protein